MGRRMDKSDQPHIQHVDSDHAYTHTYSSVSARHSPLCVCMLGVSIFVLVVALCIATGELLATLQRTAAQHSSMAAQRQQNGKYSTENKQLTNRIHLLSLPPSLVLCLYALPSLIPSFHLISSPPCP